MYIRTYSYANAFNKMLYGFCTASVVLGTWKAISPEMYIVVTILALVMTSVVNLMAIKVDQINGATASILAIIIDTLCYIGVEIYSAITGDLVMRHLVMTVVMAITNSFTTNVWEGLKEKTGKGRENQAFFVATKELGSAFGLFAALIVTLRFKYTISVTDARILQASIGWLRNAFLMHLVIKYK